MKKVIQNWVHNPGRHCGSTALSDLLHFYGISLSEAMCFGLGSGLGFFYIRGDYFNPTRTLMTRGAGLEPDFFQCIGVPFAWRTENDNARALSIAKELIDRNIPVLLQTDIYYIDYYKSKTHFNGHIVVLWGYDDEKKVAYLSDTHWEGLQEIPYSSLEKARISNFPPMILENNYFEVLPIKNSFNLSDSIRSALKKQANDMLRDDRMFGYLGIGAMKLLAEDFPSWAQAHDWKWCARFSYQVIEKRGTGGGGFRLMYSEFIKEAESILEELKDKGMSKRMKLIAGKWTELANILKRVSEAEKPLEFREAGIVIAEIAEHERSFYEDILSLLQKN